MVCDGKLRLLILGGWLLLTLLAATGCDLAKEIGRAVGPPAQTVVAQGGQIAQTQAARLLQTAQIKVATESAELRETAKVEAVTAAAVIIDTAQARLVTQSAGEVTAAPTELAGLSQTAQALLATQAAERLPFIQTQAQVLAGTIQARLGLEATTRLPLALTQVAAFNQTAEAIAGETTPIPPELITQAAGLAATGQAVLATEFSGLAPSQTPAPVQPGVTTIVYTVREGEVLSYIASLFGVTSEKLIYLNQLRLPWLASAPQNLAPGTALVVSRLPDLGMPVTPYAPPFWSETMACSVSQVDWLLSPLTCQAATIDVVTRVDMKLGCVTLDNPLGYLLTHEILQGWMLRAADGAQSYGWFVDRELNAVIVGPAIVKARSSYSECRNPQN